MFVEAKNFMKVNSDANPFPKRNFVKDWFTEIPSGIAICIFFVTTLSVGIFAVLELKLEIPIEDSFKNILGDPFTNFLFGVWIALWFISVVWMVVRYGAIYSSFYFILFWWQREFYYKKIFNLLKTSSSYKEFKQLLGSE